MGYDPLYTSGSIPFNSVDVSRFNPLANILKVEIFNLPTTLAGIV
jgi:hypothetical protein